jgi:hypothetical protein
MTGSGWQVPVRGTSNGSVHFHEYLVHGAQDDLSRGVVPASKSYAPFHVSVPACVQYRMEIRHT